MSKTEAKQNQIQTSMPFMAIYHYPYKI